MACAVFSPAPSSNATWKLNGRTILLCLDRSDDETVLLALARRAAGESLGEVHLRYASEIRGEGLAGERALHDTQAICCDEQSIKSLKHDAPELLIMTHRFCLRLGRAWKKVPLKAVRVTEAPILLLRGASMGEVEEPRNGEAVAAVSLSERSRQVVDSAASLASALSCTVRVLHLVDAMHDFSRPDNLMGLACACELLGRSTHLGLAHSEAKVCYGSISSALTKSNLSDAAFLAIGVDAIQGSKDDAATEAMLEQIIKEAPCPVLLVPTSTKQRR
jgi:hypothetical protein